MNRLTQQTPFALGFRAGADLRARLAAGPLPVPTVIETGIFNLDHYLRGGLRTGQVSVIGASTGHGKSAFVEQIVLHASKRHRTTHFALELGQRHSEVRMLSKLMGIDQDSVWNLLKSRPEHPPLLAAIDSLTYEHQLIIEERDDAEPFTSAHMFAMISANAPRLIVVDHPRHLDDWNGSDGKQRTDLAAAQIVRDLVTAAKVLDAHVMIVAQTKNQLLSKRPSAQDVADTYVLSQVASMVAMIHRPFRAQGLRDNVAEIVLDKNRSGPEGLLHLRWHGPTMRYSDLSPAEDALLECCKRSQAVEA